MWDGLVVSHQTAAVRWGLDLLRSPDLLHLTAPRTRTRIRIDGARVHRLDLAADDVTELLGELTTTPLRTLNDLGRALPLPEAVALVDSALRTRRTSMRDLRRLAGRANGRSAIRLGRAVALADPRSGSFLESYCRAVLHQGGLRPRTQYEVRVRGRFIARVDFAWPQLRLAVEVDGFAWHADRSRYRSDRQRGNRLQLAGWRVLRFAWEDVLGAPDQVVAAVRSAVGDQRYAA